MIRENSGYRIELPYNQRSLQVKREHTSTHEQIDSRISACDEDSFVKVKGQVTDLINQLRLEA